VHDDCEVAEADNASLDGDSIAELRWLATRRLRDEICERASRRIIKALRQTPQTGHFGPSFLHKSLWDEMCHDQQHGLHSSFVYDTKLEYLIGEEIEKLSQAQFEVCWLASLQDVGNVAEGRKLYFEFQGLDFEPREVVSQEVRAAVGNVASSRDIARLKVS
jgi:hypothetical protein